MRGSLVLLAAVALGAGLCPRPAPGQVAVPAAAPAGPLDFPAVWGLTLANNPSLREAEAEVEAARGRLTQAGIYPNPRFTYHESVLGTRQDPAGDLTLEASQEIVTGGKRRLDIAIAAGGVDVAALASRGRRFEVLTRVRRAYADYLAWAYTERVADETLATLEQGMAVTRRQVEEAQIRPRTDLVRLRAVLEQARLTRDRARTSTAAAWRRLAAEVGVPGLPSPPAEPAPEGPPPRWDEAAVARRTLAVNSELRQAVAEAERARLEVCRARAEAIPNVTVGGGYSANFPENQHGAVLAVEAPLPLWDRKQGRVHEAQARWARAQAARRATADRLLAEAAEAFGRYRAATQSVEQLHRSILPALQEGVRLVQQGYQAGGPQIGFADVLLAEQALGDARLQFAEAHRELARAVADLKGLMQLDVGEDLETPSPPRP